MRELGLYYIYDRLDGSYCGNRNLAQLARELGVLGFGEEVAWSPREHALMVIKQLTNAPNPRRRRQKLIALLPCKSRYERKGYRWQKREALSC